MKRILSVILAFVMTICWVPCLAAEAAFSDVPSDAWYAPYVEVCVEEGLMKGTSDTTFSPERELTLAETLVLAARLYSLVEDVEIPAVPLEDLRHLLDVLDENRNVVADFSDVVSFGPPSDLSGLRERGQDVDKGLSLEKWLAFRFADGSVLSAWGHSVAWNTAATCWSFFMEPDEPSPRFVADFGSFAADEPVIGSDLFGSVLSSTQLKFADRLMSDPSPYS